MMSHSRMKTASLSMRAPRFAWPALALALAYGVVEWIALARSRGADRLDATWRRLRLR
jgi:hypothetical protein